MLAIGGKPPDDDSNEALVGAAAFPPPKGVGALLAIGGKLPDAAFPPPKGVGALLAIGEKPPDVAREDGSTFDESGAGALTKENPPLEGFFP